MQYYCLHAKSFSKQEQLNVHMTKSRQQIMAHKLKFNEMPPNQGLYEGVKLLLLKGKLHPMQEHKITSPIGAPNYISCEGDKLYYVRGCQITLHARASPHISGKGTKLHLMKNIPLFEGATLENPKMCHFS